MNKFREVAKVAGVALNLSLLALCLGIEIATIGLV